MGKLLGLLYNSSVVLNEREPSSQSRQNDMKRNSCPNPETNKLSSCFHDAIKIMCHVYSLEFPTSHNTCHCVEWLFSVFPSARLWELCACDPVVQSHPPVRVRQRRLQPRLRVRQQGTQVWGNSLFTLSTRFVVHPTGVMQKLKILKLQNSMFPVGSLTEVE